MSQIPFPMLFAEPMPSVDLNGEYDERSQKLLNASSTLASTTFVETATGGHGDTDNDTDPD